MFSRLLTLPFRLAFGLLKKSLGKLGALSIEPLYAFGNEHTLFFKGRVVESYKQSKPSENKTYLQNILAAFRRYAGSSVPNIRVEVFFHEEKKVLTSDPEGIISCVFEKESPIYSQDEKMGLRLIPEQGIDPLQDLVFAKTVRFRSDMPRGIISDIDDTVLISHATRVGKKLWLSISKNAYTRRPFPGVSDFYQALSAGGKNPIFYVSSSDWNLFDMIQDFLRYRGIPPGPILLKDLHVDLHNIWKSGRGQHNHKFEKIEMLLGLFPGMKFILIGDSGQHDPEIYAKVIRDFPGRIEAVYIREIKLASRQRRILLKTGIEDPGAPDMTFVKDTQQAMAHARNHGLIS
jgi:phosphatidate phosphatase APP1